MRIGIDAMGGDFAPELVVQGVAMAAQRVAADTKIVLYGVASSIARFMPAHCDIEVVDCSEVIQMCDHPTESFKKKGDSSIVRGFVDLACGTIDGFASAGSTGAMMVGSMHLIKVIDGVIRPTIAASFVGSQGRPITLLDVGLNSDCKPEVLAQYAAMGSIYACQVCKIDNPRIALLNIGSEPGKGNLISKAAYQLLADNTDINFVGNVEGKHIIDGQVADVIVCDGFMGNVLLKMLESLYETLSPMGVKVPLVDGMNYEVIGGTPVLGINSTVVIGHGASSSEAICNMALATERAVASGIVDKFKSTFN